MRAAGAGEWGGVSGSSGESESDSCRKVVRVRPTGVCHLVLIAVGCCPPAEAGTRGPVFSVGWNMDPPGVFSGPLRGPGSSPGSGLELLGARLVFVQVFIGPG